MDGITKIREIALSNLDELVRWPGHAVLLWDGCLRDDYHHYPPSILELLKNRGIYRRGWSNDPAVHAFLLGGGERPNRKHRGHGWNVHHLYFGGSGALHAVKHPKHFTQSAGLVAVHPIAHALCEEDEVFTNELQKGAFERFGYDPEEKFSREAHDEFGFVHPRTTSVIFAGNCKT